MAKGRTRRKRRRRSRSPGRRKGGMMMGMRSGFKGIADSVTGNETSERYRWWGRIITILLVAAAAGFLYSKL